MDAIEQEKKRREVRVEYHRMRVEADTKKIKEAGFNPNTTTIGELHAAGVMV